MSFDTRYKIQDTRNFRLQTDASSGSTYVRWGGKSCTGSGTETVYSGYAAGGEYHDRGAGTNHLCLAPDPLYARYRTDQDAGGNFMVQNT